MRYDVSVIIAVFNPKPDLLENTIVSILKQTDVNFEIIICDDGSSVDYTNFVNTLFEKYLFHDYRFIIHEINQGTCKNIYDGVRVANGDYIKLISPGDMLFTDDTLLKFLNYAKQGKNCIFGKAAYYERTSNGIKLQHNSMHPKRYKLYYSDNYKQKLSTINYIILNDVCLGAATFVKREILDKYLGYIIDKVKYGEDSAYRLMIADGINLFFYPEFIIYYECTSGISTAKYKEWKPILDKDMEQGNICIEDLKPDNTFLIRYRLMRKIEKKVGKIAKVLVFPEIIYLKLFSRLYSEE